MSKLQDIRELAQEHAVSVSSSPRSPISTRVPVMMRIIFCKKPSPL